MVTDFTRYHPDKSVTALSLYYKKVIGKIGDYEGKKYLMVDDYTLDQVLDKIKRIGIKKHDKIKILLDADDKLPDYIIFHNVIWMTCVIKNCDKF